MQNWRNFSSSALARLTPAERAELYTRLRNDPLWKFRPLPKSDGQHHFLRRSRDRTFDVNVLLGGNRSGKTQCGAVAFAEWALWGAPKSMKARGLTSGTLWQIAKQVELSGELIWKPYLSKLIHPRNIAVLTWHNKAKQYPAFIRLNNGVEILFKSWEQGREAFQGKALMGAWADEQTPMGIIEETRARCVDYGAPLNYTLTPLEPDADLQAMYDDPPEDWHFDEICIDDNRLSRGGFIGDAEIDRLVASWPPETRETRRRGKFLGLEGSIYPSFSRSVHVADFGPDDIPAGWKHYRGIDFGFRNPFCCLWAARDPDNVWWFYDEHYEAGRTVEYHAAQIIAKSYRRKFVATYADTGGDFLPTGTEGYRVSGRKELTKFGITCSNAVRDLWSGIESVRRALMTPEGAPGPGIRVSRTHCPNLVREFPSYRVKPQASTQQSDPHELPVKMDDHAVDPCRYIIHSADLARVDKVERVEGPRQIRTSQ